MALVIRQYTYVAGQLIVASQNNTNEDTLYALINGNLTDDNFGSISESKIVFNTSTGHHHTGTDSAKIDNTGAGFLLRATTTATDSAIKGISQVASKAGIDGSGTAASSYGGYFNSTISSGLGALVENTGAGIALQVQNASSTSDHAISVLNRSTTVNKAAIAIGNSGSQSTSSGILINTITTGYGIFITNTAAGTPIRLERTTTTASKMIDIVLGGTGNNVTTGLFISQAGDVTATGRGIEISTSGAEGLSITNSGVSSGNTSLAATFSGGDGSGTANSKYVVNIVANKLGSSGAGGGLLITNSKAEGPGATVTSTISSTSGTATTDNWVLRVINSGGGPTSNALLVSGFVRVLGTLNATTVLESGAKPFLIDHPLRPLTHELRHVSIESPDMKNYYDGTVELNEFGFGVVQMPDYFLALNESFRYQVTAIGVGSECPRIASEIDKFGRFVVRGDPKGYVSWAVTGIRKDAFANKYRIQVETEKKTPGYIHADCFDE